MKNLFKVLVASVIIFSAIFSGFSAGAAETAKDENKLEVKLNVGFNDNYKIGFSTPVNISIKNNYKDIDGEVEIRVPSSPGKYMSYVKPVSLQKGAEKLITINVPIGNDNRSKYSVNIYDGDHKVYEDSITTVASNNITTFIGILSDDFDSLSYINSAPASTGMSLITKTIKLDEKNFPEDIFTLKAFNILVINDFDTSRLSKGQYEILKQWVKNGGTLIVGTGSKYNKTLSAFKDDFIQGSQGSMQEIATSKIYELATNGDNKNEARLDVLSLSVKDSAVLLEDKNVSLVQANEKGTGVVGILAFDLGKAPFVNWNNNTVFMEKILALVNPSLTSTNNINNGVTYFNNDIYGLQQAVNMFSEMATARTSSFYLILLAYILVVAPLSYFILKRLDKREWMWLTVPVLAVVFAGIVYITGSGTRLGKITTNVISYINIDNKGNVSTDTYAGILNTNKSKVKLTSQSGDRFIPVANNYYSDRETKTEVQEAKIHTGEDSGIEYKNSSLLETKIIQIQEASLELGRLETNLSLKNGKISGTIKNSTAMDLEDCLLLLPDGYYIVRSLKKGETVDLAKLNANNHFGNMYEIVNDVYFRNNAGLTGQSTVDQKRMMDLRQEGNILQRLYNYGSSQIDGIKFIGFSKTQVHSTMLVNDVQAKKNERNILIMPVDIRFADGDTLEYPMGFVPYEVINTSNVNFDMNTRRFFGNGSAEVVFRIDKAMLVEEMEVKASGKNTKATNSSYMIYNIGEEIYEPVDDIKISGEKLRAYLSSDNTVKLRLEVTDGEIGLPQMSAKGRNK
ncbi:hypothetical protein CLHUN_14800 [Ruminiclostridium hungatei]|uniref:Uncharacterized protein n=1 Tax=Ruminiclostridium hungatei TaxID=48256 RepID=A0A1V4SML7_RUMHU|nr:hypothetical protein [Ruminiclostridium hungatei]OPX44487.1 hypothetical protein CLHUN_14800 [Ruminiclostridium hungatei]